MSPAGATKSRTRVARRYPSRDQRLLIQTYRQMLGNAMAATYDQMEPYLFQVKELGQVVSEDYLEEQLETMRWLAGVLLLIRNGFRASDLEDPRYGIYGLSVPLKERTRRYRGLKRFAETANLEETYMERLEGALTGIDLAIDSLRIAFTEKIKKLIEEDTRKAQLLIADTYLKAMKVLRAAWIQLFFATHFRSVARWDLNEEDSATWHKYMDRWHEPPPFLIMEPEKLANDRNIVVHVYDSDNDLVFEVIPVEYLASVPMAEWLRSRMAKTRRVGYRWHYKKHMPETVKQFERELTDAEKRRITDFLNRRRVLDLPALPISEVAALTGAGTLEKQQEPHQWQENPPPEIDEVLLRSYMLHRRLWTMDLDWE